MGKIFCDRCKKKCCGDVLRVSDKYFHKKCFSCSKCSKSLETGGFYMKDGGFYCQEDYHRYFVAKCGACGKDLIGELVTVLNYSFHRKCFRCTNCSITFHPGDRVTVWHERFFCTRCVGQQCPVASSPVHSPKKPNGTLLSPLSMTDDEGCCTSCADTSPQDFPSPPTNGRPPLVNVDHTIEKVGEFRLPSSDVKCINSTGNPQKSKSILRKAGMGRLRTHESSRDHCGLSTDSGLGDRLYGHGSPEEQINGSLTHEHTNGISYDTALAVHSSANLSLNNSRQSLNVRVPNSDYGRFLNQSYIHLNGSLVSPESNKYKRNVSFTNLNAKQKHFHVPEGKSRFLPAGSRALSLLFGRRTIQPTSPDGSSRSQQPPPEHRIRTAKMVNSAIELSLQTSGEGSVPDGKTEEEVTAEARRLACFPSGHKRDPKCPAPIERCDWPGPPASAVILAEMMRERRYKRREQTRGSGEDADDFESQEALSIDYSYDDGANHADAGNIAQRSGIGQAIQREMNEQKRRSRSQQFIDPISASRSPNAAIEPAFKTRYSTHQFASSSGHPVKPGYTGGRLSENQKTASLPASALALVHSNRLGSGGSGWQIRNVSGHDRPSTQTSRDILSPASRPYYHSIHTLHANHLTTTTDNASSLENTFTSRLAQNGGVDSSGDLLSMATNQLSYPSVHYPPPPSAAFHKTDPPPPKIIPYAHLRTYKGTKFPKGIDKTALETYLSEEEFQTIFRLSRSAFYRLPEWKRNDLKRRVELF